MTCFFKTIPKKAIQKKSHPRRNGCNFNGALTGTRTQDPVIKSHLLYQLSYERLMLHNIAPVFENFKLKFEKKFKKIQILPQISFHWTFFYQVRNLGGIFVGNGCYFSRIFSFWDSSYFFIYSGSPGARARHSPKNLMA